MLSYKVSYRNFKDDYIEKVDYSGNMSPHLILRFKYNPCVIYIHYLSGRPLNIKFKTTITAEFAQGGLITSLLYKNIPEEFAHFRLGYNETNLKCWGYNKYNDIPEDFSEGGYI
eukprot:Mrub_13936.p1 GENE.Mrub_13936~~Mrub_13936.p1  ORF type:complete len:114 (-),score=4.11 Mrub_13936:139-480(-)